MLPFRLTDALKRGDISGTGALIVMLLVSECWRNEGVAIYEIGQLQRAVDDTRSRKTFLRELHKLRPQWIEFELGERQRKAVEFRLTGAPVRMTGDAAETHNWDTSGTNPGSDLTQSSGAVSQSEEAAGPLADTLRETLQLGQRNSRELTREDKRREEQNRPDQTLAKSCDDGCGNAAEVGYGKLSLCRACAATRKKTAAALRRRT